MGVRNFIQYAVKATFYVREETGITNTDYRPEQKCVAVLATAKQWGVKNNLTALTDDSRRHDECCFVAIATSLSAEVRLLTLDSWRHISSAITASERPSTGDIHCVCVT